MPPDIMLYISTLGHISFSADVQDILGDLLAQCTSTGLVSIPPLSNLMTCALSYGS